MVIKVTFCLYNVLLTQHRSIEFTKRVVYCSKETSTLYSKKNGLFFSELVIMVAKVIVYGGRGALGAKCVELLKKNNFVSQNILHLYLRSRLTINM